MTIDRCGMLNNVGIYCLLIGDGIGELQEEVKEKGLIDVYKELNSNDCLTLGIRDLEVRSRYLGIVGIKEKLKSISDELDLVELHCKEIDGSSVEVVVEGAFGEFGKSVAKINLIAKKYIMRSKEKIRRLDEKVGKLDSLMGSHIEHRLFADEVTLILGQCNETSSGDLTKEQVNVFEVAIEKLAERRKALLESVSKSCGTHFSKIHYEEGVIITEQFRLIKEKLAEAREAQQMGLGNTIRLLFVNLDALCSNPSLSDSINIKKTFLALTSQLRTQIFEKAGIPLIEKEVEVSVSSTKTVPVSLKPKGKMRLLPVPSRMEILLSKESSGTRNLMKGHSNQVAKLFMDPKSALDAIIAALQEFPGDYLKDSQIAEIVKKHCEKKPLDDVSQERPMTIHDVRKQEYSKETIGSLSELKHHVNLVSTYNTWNEEEKEAILKVILDSAKRGGTTLEGPNGVYYWVWFLAHENDSSAGGPNYGSINAPKDVHRLLEAIEKAMG